MGKGGPYGHGRIIWVMLAISAIAHLLLLVVAPYLWPSPKPDRQKSLQVWLSEPKRPDAPKDKRPLQVVNIPAKKTLPPKAAKYLAEFDQSTKIEKKANSFGKDGHDKLERKTINKKKSLRPKSLSDPLGIRPNFAEEHWSKASASADEPLPDVAEGDGTEVNAWQWKHAPFFNRIKERIRAIWSPQTQINRYDPHGQLLGQMSRVTTLSITIDREGRLTNLFIKDKSGVAYLDEEAVRSLKAASPFLFPPEELFDGKDEFSFTFAFHLEVNRGFSLNFDWDK